MLTATMMFIRLRYKNMAHGVFEFFTEMT